MKVEARSEEFYPMLFAREEDYELELCTVFEIDDDLWKQYVLARDLFLSLHEAVMRH